MYLLFKLRYKGYVNKYIALPVLEISDKQNYQDF